MIGLKRYLFTISLFIPVCLFAQKQNEIKLLGAELDLLLKTSDPGVSEVPFNNKLVGFVGYNRLIGSHIAVGISYHKFINFEENVSGGSYDALRYDFNETAWGLGYHSRYFFNDYDYDGSASGYIEFTLNRTSISQSYTNVQEYTNSIFGSGSFEDRSPFSRKFGITRFGINIGLIDSDIVTQDISIGLYFNGSPSSTSAYSLTDVRGVSFMVTYSMGIGF